MIEENGDVALWVLTCAPAQAGAPAGFAQSQPDAGLGSVWQSVDGRTLRAYAAGPTRPGPSWQALRRLQEVAGASAGDPVLFHYVVETDVLPENIQQLNDWYTREHLPGLAAVPGTVRAARYLRLEGAPTFYACYDLTSLATLRSEPWQAVRHTDWSARVRPLFRNTLRTEFRRMPAVSDSGRVATTA